MGVECIVVSQRRCIVEAILGALGSYMFLDIFFGGPVSTVARAYAKRISSGGGRFKEAEA